MEPVGEQYFGNLNAVVVTLSDANAFCGTHYRSIFGGISPHVFGSPLDVMKKDVRDLLSFFMTGLRNQLKADTLYERDAFWEPFFPNQCFAIPIMTSEY